MYRSVALSTLVDDLVRDIVQWLEVRDLEGANGVDRHGQHVFGRAQSALISELSTSGPEQTKNLSTVESLTLTMFAKTHRSSYSG